MCLADYDPNPDFEEELARAQAEAQDRETIPAAMAERCALCKRWYPESKTYRTAAGTICNDCAAEFADPGF